MQNFKIRKSCWAAEIYIFFCRILLYLKHMIPRIFMYYVCYNWFCMYELIKAGEMLLCVRFCTFLRRALLTFKGFTCIWAHTNRPTTMSCPFPNYTYIVLHSLHSQHRLTYNTNEEIDNLRAPYLKNEKVTDFRYSATICSTLLEIKSDSPTFRLLSCFFSF